MNEPNRTELVNLTAASKITGVSIPALKRRVQRGEIAGWRDPADRRAILVRASDLEHLRLHRLEPLGERTRLDLPLAATGS
jgi:hypothetical protein